MNVDIELRDLIKVINKKNEITLFDLRLQRICENCIKTIERLSEEKIILKNLLCKIRSESRKCDLSNRELFGQYYRPIRNTTKQEVYNSYQKIKEMVLGEYEFITDGNAINRILEEKRSS